jgi:hypothetical protein
MSEGQNRFVGSSLNQICDSSQFDLADKPDAL